MKTCFRIPRLLIPRENFRTWAVPAEDCAHGDEKFWQEVEHTVGDAPSALRFLLPFYHKEADKDIFDIEIVTHMYEALEDGTLEKLNRGAVLTIRTFPDGAVRQGIVAAFDLEQYGEGEKALFRPAYPPKDSPETVAVRRLAPLEFSPAVVYYRDKRGKVMRDISAEELELLYDFDLMQGGGNLKGYFLPEDLAADMLGAMPRHGTAFLVAEGAEFVSSAKRFWEELKPTLPADNLQFHPARFVLAEFVDLTALPVRSPMCRYLACGDQADLALLSKAVKSKRDGDLLCAVHPGADAIRKADAALSRIAAQKGGEVQYFSGRTEVKRALAEGGIAICFPPFSDDDFFEAAEAGFPPHCFPEIGGTRYILEGREISYD